MNHIKCKLFYGAITCDYYDVYVCDTAIRNIILSVRKTFFCLLLVKTCFALLGSLAKLHDTLLVYWMF